MADELRITESQPANTPEVLGLGGDSDQPLSHLRPWMEALSDHLALTADTLADIGRSVEEQSAESADTPHDTAARIGLQIAEERANGTTAADAGVGAGLYFLKSQRFEAGESPANHWRLNRPLNTGSRAVDYLVGDERFRVVAVEALFYRILKQALGQRPEISPSGVVAETSCAVDWNGDGRRPWRCELPPETDNDAELRSVVVDWLLEEFLARGFSSVTLGSVVVEEGGGARTHELDDALADWLGELPADEACLVTGAVFGPGRLGGWERPPEDRLLDAFAVAKNVVDDIAFEEAKTEVYGSCLERIEALRRIPSRLSPTLQFDDGNSTRRARWSVSVYPLRREKTGRKGFFALEAGIYFEEPNDDVARWSATQKRSAIDQLRERIAEEDERSYGRFAELLDDVVERVNTCPGVLVTEDSDGGPVGRPSPLWKRLDRGIDELRDAVETGDAAELADAFERWTFPVGRGD